MIEIQVNNLVKSFEVGHNVLDGVTFQIDQGQRVGLLGKNGAGKSTLFKILIGELDCDEGTVTISPGHRMGLISQIPVYPEGYTVDDVLRSAFGRLHALTAEMEELAGRMAAGETDPAILKRYGSLSERFEVFGGYDTDVAISKVANGLSISDDMRGRLFDQLSGGEKTRVNLGRLILEDTDILLLDEPTNHLDLHATEWLEAYIQKFRGTVVAISHDRYFLDRSVNRVIEIENGKAEFYSGNYSFYAVEKERRYQERMKQYEKEQAKIAQLEKSAEQLRMWAFQGMDKTYRRAISMERRIERMRTTAKPTKARKMDARFTAAEFHGDEVLGIRNLSKAYGEKPLFEGISLKVEGGERIALIGDNGTGKSTLIKMIADEVYPDSGRIRLGPQVKLAYLPQIIHFDHPDWNLVENMMAAKRGISAQSARNRLAAYDFRGEDVLKPVSVLSGGEQSRLRLCMLMDDEINFLILDEPTNHLDIQAIEWLEDFLMDCESLILVVSHDRHFLNTVCTNIVDVDYGHIKMYVGNYEFWYESSQMVQRMMKDQNRKNEEKIKELQLFIQRFSANKSKSKQATARRKLLDKLTVEEMPASSRRYPFVGFTMERECGKEILAVEGISKTLDGRKVLDNVSFRVNKGDKIAFVGEDEIAKTTLFKIVMGEMEPDEGTYKWGTTITTSYFPLDNSAFFNDCDLNLVDWLAQFTPKIPEANTESFKRAFLGRMLFSGDDVFKPVKVLSGGEKVRCMLSRMMLYGSNVLVLDQPTNHLDLESITAVNNGLMDFKGVVLFSSHDHEFVQTIANRIMVLEDGKLTDRLGTYEDYIASMANTAE